MAQPNILVRTIVEDPLSRALVSPRKRGLYRNQVKARQGLGEVG
jgi:hypothetical protein